MFADIAETGGLNKNISSTIYQRRIKPLSFISSRLFTKIAIIYKWKVAMIAFLWIVRIKFLPIENLIIQTAPFIKDRLRILPDIIAIVAQIKNKNLSGSREVTYVITTLK